MTLIDGKGWSCTYACDNCSRGLLAITSPKMTLLIPLVIFAYRTDVGPREQSDIPDDLVSAVIANHWPSLNTVCQFAIKSERHLHSLQHAVLAGVTSYDLNRVMGDGPAITALIRGIPGQPYPETVFSTYYDIRFGNVANE